MNKIIYAKFDGNMLNGRLKNRIFYDIVTKQIMKTSTPYEASWSFGGQSSEGPKTRSGTLSRIHFSFLESYGSEDGV